MRQAFIAFISVFVVSTTLSAQQRPAPSPASSVFSTIDTMVTNGATLTEEEFNATLREEGFRKDDSVISVWRLRRADGELRVLPTFAEDGTFVSIMYFPAVAGRVPDPMISWLLENSAYRRLNDGDEMVIGLPSKDLGEVAHKRGRKQEEVSFSLNGGALIRTRLYIEWKRISPGVSR